MKKMKKILAFVLAMAMVLGMSVTAFAEEDDIDPGMMTDSVIGNSNDRGTIEVKGITVEDGITVQAYQIIKAKYDTNDTFSGYELIYPNVTPAIKLDDTTGDNALVTIGEAQLSAIVDHIMTTKKLNCTEGHTHSEGCYLDVNNVAENTVYDMALDNNGVATAENLPVGSYLVLIKGAETKVYNPAVVSIYYDVVEDKENVLGGGKLDIVSTENVWVKVSDTPTVDKVMAGEEGNKKGNSVDIGDDVEYYIPISPIPNYGGEHPVLNIVDTLSEGLTYNNDLKVFVYVSNVSTDDVVTGATVEKKELTLNEDYTVSTKIENNKTTLTVDFVVDGYATEENKAVNDYTLNDYVGNTVVIAYSAKLNDKALINDKDNVNSVTLNYTKDSKIDSDDVKGKDEKKTYTYTFDIDGAADGESTVEKKLTEGILTKTGEKTEKEITLGTEKIKDVLAEAEFTLYTVDPDHFTPKNGNDKIDNYIYKNGVDTKFDGVVKSNDRGQLPIKGLAEGTYYLKETKAPDGYSLNTHVFKIVIKAEYYEEGDTLPQDVEYGQLKNWTIEIGGTSTNTFTVSHDGGTTTVYTNATSTDGTITDGNIKPVLIPNTKLSSLPSTGGIGTTIFTIGGCAIMIIAAGLFFASRRKSSK